MDQLKLFSEKLPGLRLVHDATSLTSAWTCPQKYLREMIEGRRASGSGNKHLHFGRVLHKGFEVLHNERFRKQPEDHALRAAVMAAVTEAGWRDGSGADAEWQPWQSVDKKKNLHTLLRALVWYADDLARGEGGEVQTMGLAGESEFGEPYVRPATELEWRWKLPEKAVTGEEYWLVGNCDRIVEWDGDRWALECKTTGSEINDGYWAQWAPNVQLKTYDLGLAMAHPEWDVQGSLLEAHQVGVGFSRWARQPVRQPEGTREQWLQQVQQKLVEIEGWVEAWQAAGCAAFEDNYTACNKWGGGCWLRGVCKRTWGERARLLQGLTVEHWNPMMRSNNDGKLED